MDAKHYLLDLYDVNTVLLTDKDLIESILKKSAQLANAHILHSYFHKFGGYGGVTGVLALAESHISIHTWPENNYASVDVFMCGDSKPLESCRFIIKEFEVENYKLELIERGKK